MWNEIYFVLLQERTKAWKSLMACTVADIKHTTKYKTMAIVKPFKGIRPPKDLVEQVESRPYDVLDSEEARDRKSVV